MILYEYRARHSKSLLIVHISVAFLDPDPSGSDTRLVQKIVIKKSKDNHTTLVYEDLFSVKAF